jgi:hypothetical protein
MNRPVDRDQIALYLLDELNDTATADVERLVADDANWAAALQEEAQMDMAIYAVVDEALAQEAAVAGVQTSPQAATGEARQGQAWWRRWLVPAALGPMLAAWLLVVGLPGSPEQMPSYELEMVSRGEMMTRGEADPKAGPAVFTDGSGLKLVLRPKKAYGAKPQVRVSIDGDVVDVDLRITGSGAVRIQGVFGDDLPSLSVGDHQLEVRIAAPGEDLDVVEPMVETLRWRAPSE